jgi:hypothetical protein
VDFEFGQDNRPKYPQIYIFSVIFTPLDTLTSKAKLSPLCLSICCVSTLLLSCLLTLYSDVHPAAEVTKHRNHVSFGDSKKAWDYIYEPLSCFPSKNHTLAYSGTLSEHCHLTLHQLHHPASPQPCLGFDFPSRWQAHTPIHHNTIQITVRTKRIK